MIIRDPAEIERFLSKHQTKLEHPEAYIGKEPNTFHKNWDKAKYRILIAGLWRYEDGRGNQTLPLLYQMINEQYGDDVICERSFFPNSEKDYRAFRNYRIPIFGLESKRSMGEYDLVLTSLSFLPPWVNFPLMLRMSGINPFWNQGRGHGEEPLFMVGGSAVYGNFSVVYPCVDIIYLGDAEPGLFPLLDAIMQGKDLYSLQKKFNYIFTPSNYIPKYTGVRFEGWLHDKELPDKLERIICEDLNEVASLTKPYPSYLDASMGLGELELSRGCRATCVYCGLGWKYRPYRERTRLNFVNKIKENMMHSGTFKGLCPIAAEFAYYGEKRELFNDLRKLSKTVDPLSMRVDAFVQDPDFAKYLADSGMRNLAIGVEGISQRIRNWMGKGITEEDIYQACHNAIVEGMVKKIKFFLISNVGETKDDYEEFFTLLERIISDKYAQRSKIKLKVSWTPLFVEPCTPLQWKHPTIEMRQPWKEISNKLDALKIEYPRGGGGKNAEDFMWALQGMHLGDTRFAAAIALASLDEDRPLYVAFSKTFKDSITKRLGSFDTSWTQIMREKDEDELFPWDIVDRGVVKKALYTIYSRVKSDEAEKKHKTVVRPPLDLGVIDKYPVFNDNMVASGWRFLVRAEIDPGFETVPNVHWVAQIHRAARLNRLPIAVNSVKFVSDRACRNWYCGYEFFFIGFNQPIFEWSRFSDNMEAFNEFLDLMNDDLYGLRLIDSVNWQGKPSYKKFFSGYTVESDVSPRNMECLLLDFLSAKKRIVIARESRYFSGERKKNVDVKAPGVFYDLEVNPYAILPTLKVKIGDAIGVRYFLRGFFSGVSPARTLGFPVVKTNLYRLDKENKLESIF